MKKLFVTFLLTTFTLGQVAGAAETSATTPNDCIAKYNTEISRIAEKMSPLKLSYNDGKGREPIVAILTTVGTTAAGAVGGGVAGAAVGSIGTGVVMAAALAVSEVALVTASGLVYSSIGLMVGAPLAVGTVISAGSGDEGTAAGFGFFANLPWLFVPMYGAIPKIASAGATVFNAGGLLPWASILPTAMAGATIGAYIGAGVGAAAGLAVGSYDNIKAVKIHKLYKAKQLLEAFKSNDVIVKQNAYDQLNDEIKKKYNMNDIAEMLNRANDTKSICSSDKLPKYKTIVHALEKDVLRQY